MLIKYKRLEITKTRELGQEGISYWKERIASFNKLSRREAISMLVKAHKIEEKIKTIERVISQDYL